MYSGRKNSKPIRNIDIIKDIRSISLDEMGQQRLAAFSAMYRNSSNPKLKKSPQKISKLIGRIPDLRMDEASQNGRIFQNYSQIDNLN